MAKLTRRTFLKLSVVSAAASLSLSLGGCDDDDDHADVVSIETGSRFFPQSLASGDPRPTSVVL